MRQLTSSDLREMFLRFFQEKGHRIIPSASVIPENDPSVLFTTAGMHPLVPYLLGAKHPAGTRLTDVQKCIRTGDIDDVGDNSHLTFFEMLGNWSLGDYFKKEAISWSWEFLTDEKWLGLDPDKLAFSVFAGNEDAPRDEEAYQLWLDQGVKSDRIFFLPAENNWWKPGPVGPCGPDTEMFIITDKPPCGPDCSPACDCGRYLEIWNNVFMQFSRDETGALSPLSQKNVDTGMGLERTLCVLTGADNVYETELFADILSKIADLSGKDYRQSPEVTRAFRIIADHMRTSVFILGDDRGVAPSNVDQGYVLRRLIRRTVRMGRLLGIDPGFTPQIAEVIIRQYQHVYPELEQHRAFILEQLTEEEERFQRTLTQGIKEFERSYGKLTALAQQVRQLTDPVAAFARGETDEAAMKQALTAAFEAQGKRIEAVKRNAPEAYAYAEKAASLTGAQLQRLAAEPPETLASIGTRLDGATAFRLYDTYGFPIEMTEEMAKERGLSVDREGFEASFRHHQELSHAGAEQRFKGGLADHSDATTHLHTATHLLHAALRKLVDPSIEQRGSNITTERLRFDFNLNRKVTPEELKKVEDWVNAAIEAKADIVCEEMPVDAARASGAIGLFGNKYGDVVKVYTMGDFSKEICGGPHAANTGELGHFHIVKEESSSAGIRRIKAVLEK